MNYLQSVLLLLPLLISTTFTEESSDDDDESIPEPMMKAVVLTRFGKPETLKIQSVPVPRISDKQILVKVKAAGINPVDAYIRAGTCKTLPTLPAILGKEIAGIVEEVDVTVHEFKVGERVFCGVEDGGYAEFAAANVSSCYPLAETLSFAQGSAIYTTYFAVYRGIVIKGRLSRDKAILIHGAVGYLATAAVQIAKEVGARVAVTVRSKYNEKLMRDCGADFVSFHDGNYMEEALASIRKKEFSVILEMLPGFDLNFDRQYLQQEGRIIILGSRLPDKRNARNTYVVSYFKYAEEDQADAAEFILDAIEVNGITPIISKTYPLDEAMKAHYNIAYNNTEKGKIVFVL